MGTRENLKQKKICQKCKSTLNYLPWKVVRCFWRTVHRSQIREKTLALHPGSKTHLGRKSSTNWSNPVPLDASWFQTDFIANLTSWNWQICLRSAHQLSVVLKFHAFSCVHVLACLCRLFMDPLVAVSLAQELPNPVRTAGEYRPSCSEIAFLDRPIYKTDMYQVSSTTSVRSSPENPVSLLSMARKSKSDKLQGVQQIEVRDHAWVRSFTGLSLGN